MQFLKQLFGPKPVVDPREAEKEGAKLNARRRHLRALMAHHKRELHNLWTDYRRSSDPEERQALKARIRVVKAENKATLKEMSRVAARMRQLGFNELAPPTHIS